MTFRACDQCRVRRVKCEAEGKGCITCNKKNLDCTFNDPILKRGPKSKIVDLTPSPKSVSPVQSILNHNRVNSQIHSQGKTPSGNISEYGTNIGQIERYDSPKPRINMDPEFLNEQEKNIYFVDGKLTKLGLEYQLVEYFMQMFNPLLGYPVSEENLINLRGEDPTFSESFLFFSICTCAAMHSDLGLNSSSTLYYYSHAASFIQMDDSERDDVYFKALFIMDYLKKVLYNALFVKSIN